MLATFGLILFFNELVRIIWGPASVYMNVPAVLSGTVNLFGLPLPVVPLRDHRRRPGRRPRACTSLIHRTRVGMLIRAGATHPEMVAALGVNVRRLNTLVFGLGAALAGLAGLMAGPIVSVQSGMGEPILILTLVVIVTGGIGSIRGAFYGALIVGIVDTIGRAFLPDAAARVPRTLAGAGRGTGDRVDADLPADGGGAGDPAAGPVSGEARMS